MIKQEKGVTLVALITTVIVLTILTGVTFYSIKSSNSVGPYNKMVADITLLEDKILIYYNKFHEIPKKLEEGQPISETFEGEEVYYEIDLEKLDNLTLYFGTDEEDETDRYFVNNKLKVYYKRGIEEAGTTYHKRYEN